MKLNDIIKASLREWLNVKEANNNGTIVINETLDFRLNAIKNELWYRGDPSELHQFYTQFDDGVQKTSFWAGTSTTGINFRKIHTGIPKLIIKTLVDIVIDDMNDVNFAGVPGTDGKQTEDIEAKQRWELIAAEHDFKEKILKDAVKKALLGDCALKLSYDKTISDFPLIEVISGQEYEPDITRGRITALKFYFRKNIDKKDYVLEETYDIGGVRYKLYDENGKDVSVGLIEQLFSLRPFKYDGKFIMAVPFLITPSSKYPGRGESIYDGKEGAFDSLDEAWSQWVDALRDGRTRTYIPDDFIPKNASTGVSMAPSTFDSRFIALLSDKGENGSNKVQVESPDIKYDAYLATYITALDLCLQGLISPSTLGIDVKKLDNAEAQREKEKATLYTRGKIVRVLQSIVPKLIDTVLKVDDLLNKREPGTYDISVDFGEYANPSFEAVVETVGKAKSYNIMSLEQCVDELYGDSWTDEEKLEEVTRLKFEQGIGIAEPSINATDPTFVDPTQKPAVNLNGDQTTA